MSFSTLVLLLLIYSFPSKKASNYPKNREFYKLCSAITWLRRIFRLRKLVSIPEQYVLHTFLYISLLQSDLSTRGSHLHLWQGSKWRARIRACSTPGTGCVRDGPATWERACGDRTPETTYERKKTLVTVPQLLRKDGFTFHPHDGGNPHETHRSPQQRCTEHGQRAAGLLLPHSPKPNAAPQRDFNPGRQRPTPARGRVSPRGQPRRREPLLSGFSAFSTPLKADGRLSASPPSRPRRVPPQRPLPTPRSCAGHGPAAGAPRAAQPPQVRGRGRSGSRRAPPASRRRPHSPAKRPGAHLPAAEWWGCPRSAPHPPFCGHHTRSRAGRGRGGGRSAEQQEEEQAAAAAAAKQTAPPAHRRQSPPAARRHNAASRTRSRRSLAAKWEEAATPSTRASSPPQ